MIVTLSQVLKFLEDRHGIITTEQLSLGNVCKSVFRAKLNSRSIVVKIGIGEREQQEIAWNRAGYKNILRIGGKAIIPDPCYTIRFRKVLIMVMGDCGKDFWHAVQVAYNPVFLYKRLITELMSLYRNTIKKKRGASAGIVESIRDRLTRQYSTYLFPVFGEDKKLMQRLANLDCQKYHYSLVCFSSFDFTPEDVFLPPSGLKFCDPLPEVIGIPIIDLACFGGVARDVYCLPGSKEGYLLLEKFALGKVSEFLMIKEGVARAFFNLGRALQCALSSRFRLESEPEKAQSFYDMSRSFSGEFVNFKK
jgi:hypothetical protein